MEEAFEEIVKNTGRSSEMAERAIGSVERIISLKKKYLNFKTTA
jgi:hypothetical protein